MAQAKSELFDRELNEQANLFKALAHPARLRILQFLAETKSCITGNISDDLPLGRTTVNQHLKELKNVGLIEGHIEGVTTKYCLKPEKVNELKQSIQVYFDNLNTANYTCE